MPRASILAVGLLLGPLHADACSIRGYSSFELEPLAPSVVTELPVAPILASIERGRRTANPAMDCGDAGTLEFSVASVEGVGYVFESVAGNLPTGLFPDVAVTPRDGTSSRLIFPWRDYPRLPAEFLIGAVRVTVVNARGMVIGEHTVEVNERDIGI